jgi:hypothetical protein
MFCQIWGLKYLYLPIKFDIKNKICMIQNKILLIRLKFIEFYPFVWSDQIHNVQAALVIRRLFIWDFYLRFRLFAIQSNIPNLTIRGLSLAYSRFFNSIGHKNQLTVLILSCTVFPHYSRFRYLQYFSWTYLLRISRATCIFK